MVKEYWIFSLYGKLEVVLWLKVTSDYGKQCTDHLPEKLISGWCLVLRKGFIREEWDKFSCFQLKHFSKHLKTDLQVFEYKCTRQSSPKLQKRPWLPLSGWEMNGGEWEGCFFVCVVHSITLMKNAGKLPPFKMLVRLSCLCFIFGCYHGYWWKKWKPKGGGR